MKALVESLYGRMPREFATPNRRTVGSARELLDKIDAFNGLSDCYVSAHSFAADDPEEASYEDAVIDKAVFDFDDAWEHLYRTHEWLEERGAAHVVVFSGSERSGHIYVLCEPTRDQRALEYFQRDVVVSGAGLRRCAKCGGEVRKRSSDLVPYECTNCGSQMEKSGTRLVVDPNLLGDIATMVRIPNTYHPGAERFCVPLRPEEVTPDPDDALEHAGSQRDLTLSDVVCGDRVVDLAQAPKEGKAQYMTYAERQRMTGFDATGSGYDDFSAEVAPAEMADRLECECWRSVLFGPGGDRLNPELGHDDRVALISHLVERGYNPAEVSKFLRYAIDEEKAAHSVVEEKQPMRLYENGVKSPNAFSMKERGLYEPGCPVHSQTGAGG